MTRFFLNDNSLDVDVDQTRAMYIGLQELDLLCCNACAATFVCLKRNAFPPELMSALSHVGVDLTKPVQAWGAPDGGFLQIWWPVVVSALGAETPSLTYRTGDFKVELTWHYPAPGFTPRAGFDVPAIELTWSGSAVKSLEAQIERD
jgi:hypothetical protein